MKDQAIEQAYEQHAPMLRRLALRATGDPQRAEDVVQEAFLRLWRRPDGDIEHVGAYLTRSVRNLVVDQARSRTRRPLELRQPDELPEPPSGMAEVDRALEQLLVEEALGRLSPPHRQVVRALHYERLSVRETAERLGVPEGTVKSRAYYALRQLRTVLDEMGVSR